MSSIDTHPAPNFTDCRGSIFEPRFAEQFARFHFHVVRSRQESADSNIDKRFLLLSGQIFAEIRLVVPASLHGGLHFKKIHAGNGIKIVRQY